MKILLKLLMVLVVALPLAGLWGCSGAQDASVYGKENTEITVGAGQTFTIGLEENPTTGYQWTVTIADSIVELTKDEYYQAKTDPQIVGSGGQRVLTFKGTQNGETTITLKYERSFEENSTVETLVYHVTVE